MLGMCGVIRCTTGTRPLRAGTVPGPEPVKPVFGGIQRIQYRCPKIVTVVPINNLFGDVIDSIES